MRNQNRDYVKSTVAETVAAAPSSDFTEFRMPLLSRETKR